MILVFGSINLDIFFRCERLPVPGETLLCPRAETAPGGKGANQALAARRAGSAVALIGNVGRDAFAQEALSLLARDGVDLSAIGLSDESTGCATIAVSATGENAIVVGSGANMTLEASQVPDGLLNEETIVLLQMEVPLTENWVLAKRAHARGAKVMLNVAPASDVPSEILRVIDILLVNEIEVRQLGASHDLKDAEEGAIAQHLSDKFGPTVVLTLGGKGSVTCAAGKKIEVPAIAISAHDTTGAGDCFAGYLAAGLDQGIALKEALAQATVASGLCCTHAGAQPAIPDRAAVEARINRGPQK